MEPEYLFDNKICLVIYKDSIDFEFCQNHSLIKKQYITQSDIFVLDLKQVSFIDSAGIGNLVGIFRSLDAQSKSLCLINISPNIRKVLQISEIEHIFPIFNSLQDARFHYLGSSAP
ncbi:MAG: STAS domain-containing protein [Candidatus Cloacimonetes bacterium]|nr:STAS domain-containing protein [Candidatus Cloacimonadota bacterium]